MYQIIGVQRNQEQRLVATPATAREALTHYRASLRLFGHILINAPDGRAIDLAELNILAEEEANA